MQTFWGRTGHYGITTLATDFMADGILRDFFAKNLNRISYPLKEIADPGFDQRVEAAGEAGEFIPLADVPDEIWKQWSKADDPQRGRIGGRANPGGDYSSGPENPNHYADVDIAPAGEDMNWRDQCLANSDLISPEIWDEQFYNRLPHNVAPEKRGLSPFRVWQLFDAMADCLRSDDVDGFLVAAGVCAHYVGDSCQPMHGSVMANGDSSRHVHRIIKGERKEVVYGIGSHEWYESHMVAANVDALIAGVKAAATPAGHGLNLCAAGRDTARATLQLMYDVAHILPPVDIVNSFQEALSNYGDQLDEAVAAADEAARATITSVMWQQLGSRTVEVMIEGARALAMIWESGWAHAGHPQLAAKALDKEALTARYVDPEFLPSKEIRDIRPLLGID